MKTTVERPMKNDEALVIMKYIKFSGLSKEQKEWLNELEKEILNGRKITQKEGSDLQEAYRQSWSPEKEDREVIGRPVF